MGVFAFLVVSIGLSRVVRAIAKRGLHKLMQVLVHAFGGVICIL
jgi:hypothetical protein